MTKATSILSGSTAPDRALQAMAADRGFAQQPDGIAVPAGKP